MSTRKRVLTLDANESVQVYCATKAISTEQKNEFIIVKYAPQYLPPPPVSPGPTIGFAVNQLGTVSTVDCGHNGVVVGIGGAVGSWLDQFSLLCKTVNSDGSLSRVFGTTGIGGSGGQGVTQICPEGTIAGGFGGAISNANQYVAGVTINCFPWDRSTKQPIQALENGAVSGRHLRHGRKPATSAAAADGKNVTLTERAGRTGQTARQ